MNKQEYRESPLSNKNIVLREKLRNQQMALKNTMEDEKEFQATSMSGMNNTSDFMPFIKSNFLQTTSLVGER